MSVVPASSLIESSIAYPLVIGCSIFSIGWGIINIIMVRSSANSHEPRPFDKVVVGHFPSTLL